MKSSFTSFDLDVAPMPGQTDTRVNISAIIFRLLFPLTPLLICVCALSSFAYAQSECGDDYTDIYNGDCDFKNEDTNLYFNQPAKKFIEDEDVERILDDSKSFIEVYYNTTKVTGDAAIIADVARMAAEVHKIEAMQVIQTATILANDPYSLKPAYTDAICEAFWSAIDEVAESAGYPVGDRKCATTSELLINIQNIQALDNRARQVEDILQNQFRNIGEVWGDMVDEAQRFKDQFTSPETLSHNLTPGDIVTQYNERYSSFAEMIANPVLSPDQWTQRFTVMDETVNATIRDTLIATQANARSLIGEQFFQTPAQIAANTTVPYISDFDEITERNQKSRDSVGRMQQMELKNMSASLSGQEWVDITSQLNAAGFMFGNDMAKELAEENYKQSLSVQLRRELPPIPDRQQFGNEVVYQP